MQKIPTAYVDNNFCSAFFSEDPEQFAATRELWSLREAGCVRFVASTVTAMEAFDGPLHVRDFFMANFPDTDAILKLTDEARALGSEYIRAGILPKGSLDDAHHIAICTLAGIEALLSWNFHHVSRRETFNEINRLHGYGPVRILKPNEYLKEIC